MRRATAPSRYNRRLYDRTLRPHDAGHDRFAESRPERGALRRRLHRAGRRARPHCRHAPKGRTASLWAFRLRHLLRRPVPRHTGPHHQLLRPHHVVAHERLRSAALRLRRQICHRERPRIQRSQKRHRAQRGGVLCRRRRRRRADLILRHRRLRCRFPRPGPGSCAPSHVQPRAAHRGNRPIWQLRLRQPLNDRTAKKEQSTRFRHNADQCVPSKNRIA